LDKPLDEKIDIFSFGNNIYALLTGLWPFYEDGGENDDLVQHRVIDGVKPYVDPRYRNRSIAEGVLVQMMEACWAYDPADRPTINQIVGTLQKTVDSLNVPHG
jgi:serine/threonine protein kinase